MKGTILVCLRDMLRDEKAMTDTQWSDILEASGLERHRMILLMSDIDDAVALRMLGEAQQRYYGGFEEIADAYGRYWCVVYAPKIYASIYEGIRSAREFILRMDQVHVMVTRTMANARPPRFNFEEVGDDTFMVTYASPRGLIHLYAGLARGVGAYFGERLDVQVLGQDKVSIRFAA